MTIFLTTHYMEEAARASHIAIIDAGEIKEYGTPFSMKEAYAKDKLNLIPRSDKQSTLKEYLTQQGIAYKQRDEILQIRVKDSMASLPLLNEVSSMIEGFEVVQGSMDDVFLNVTGRKLEG